MLPPHKKQHKFVWHIFLFELYNLDVFLRKCARIISRPGMFRQMPIFFLYTFNSTYLIQEHELGDVDVSGIDLIVPISAYFGINAYTLFFFKNCLKLLFGNRTRPELGKSLLYRTNRLGTAPVKQFIA